MSNKILKELSTKQLEKYEKMFYDCGKTCYKGRKRDPSLCDIGIGNYCNGLMNGDCLENGAGLWIEPGNVDSAFNGYTENKKG